MVMEKAADNQGRLLSDAFCGISPLPASSGKTKRHRLNRGRIGVDHSVALAVALHIPGHHLAAPGGAAVGARRRAIDQLPRLRKEMHAQSSLLWFLPAGEGIEIIPCFWSDPQRHPNQGPRRPRRVRAPFSTGCGPETSAEEGNAIGPEHSHRIPRLPAP